ncbi:MAG: putative toxin-antitoxin system toxin component, PIN family [Bacteroidetes bacterium GWA2_30_7]|nr:MAG: putative toxin-antitoxin system toxin component, PIN family [Bacteroidetes bacterium GWA2_30_7]
MKRENKSFKIIIDTNIWISFLIGKTLKGLQVHIDSQFFRIISCNEQLQELSEVFKKNKIKKYLSIKQIEEFFELFSEFSEIIELKTRSSICRDLKDNYLVSLAIDSNADFLITGDNDLLELNKIGNTLIVRYSEFDKLIKK